jgi:hypothetical protein
VARGEAILFLASVWGYTPTLEVGGQVFSLADVELWLIEAASVVSRAWRTGK